MYDPAGKAGLSVMTVTTMARGTTTRDGTNIRDGMEAAGATTLQTSVTPELASLNFDVVAKNIDPAFAILADVVTHPDFKKFSLDSQKQQWTDMVSQAENDAGELAQSIAPALIFLPHKRAWPAFSGTISAASIVPGGGPTTLPSSLRETFRSTKHSRFRQNISPSGPETRQNLRSFRPRSTRARARSISSTSPARRKRSSHSCSPQWVRTTPSASLSPSPATFGATG
jgi:hypothetical protein